MSKLLKGGILGGLVLFIWGAISWTVLPWHMDTFEKFPDENAASVFIQQLPTSGMYLLPLTQKLDASATAEQQSKAEAENTQRKATGPIVFASVSKQGTNDSMLLQLGVSLLTQIIAALLVTKLILIKPHSLFSGRFFQVMLFALAAGVVAHIPHMNWFYFSQHYTIVSILDLLIGWLLAGFVISHFTRPSYPSFH